MADGRAPMGIPHAVEDSVCLGRSVGMAFKDVPTTKIASQVMELGSLSTTSWYKLLAAFMTSNPNFLGLQCVISASLPYCTDIDECQDARPAFNKAAHCGDHAVVFWFLTCSDMFRIAWTPLGVSIAPARPGFRTTTWCLAARILTSEWIYFDWLLCCENNQ